MIDRATLVALLRTHGRRRNVRDLRTHCLCGWASDAPNGAGQHLDHQADEVLAELKKAARRGAKTAAGGDAHWDEAWKGYDSGPKSEG